MLVKLFVTSFVRAFTDGANAACAIVDERSLVPITGLG